MGGWGFLEMKTVYFLLLAVMSTVTLNACTQPEAVAPMKAEELKGDIKVMVPGGLNHTTFLEVIRRQFKEKHPGVNVLLELIPEDNQLTEQISAGNVPDIYIGEFGYQPVKFARDKLIIDLKDLPGSTELFGRIAPQFVQEYNGGKYFVPWYANAKLMIYYKDLFREAGLIQRNRRKHSISTWSTLRK